MREIASEPSWQQHFLKQNSFQPVPELALIDARDTKILRERIQMTLDKPQRKPSIQLLLSDMQAQTSCQRQRIADEIGQTPWQLGCSNPIDSLEQCFSGNETRTCTSCTWQINIFLVTHWQSLVPAFRVSAHRFRNAVPDDADALTQSICFKNKCS